MSYQVGLRMYATAQLNKAKGSGIFGVQVLKVSRLLQGICKQLLAGLQHSLQPSAGWHAGRLQPRPLLRAGSSSSGQMA